MKAAKKNPKNQQQPQNNSTLSKSLAIVGSLLWISTIQFYVVQIIAANAWVKPFSYTQNFISDLGAVQCTQLLCSPQNVLMNASFIILGFSILIGALLFAFIYRNNIGATIGFLCLALSGLGTIFVGIFPLDTNGEAHGTGAFTSFLVGNIGLIIIGFSLKEVTQILRYLALILGIIATLFLPFYTNNIYFNIGVGTIERIIAYPQTIWMIIFGLAILRQKYLIKDESRNK